MDADYGETVRIENEYPEPIEEKRDNKIWIIIVVVAVVLLCCCIVSVLGIYWIYNTAGDQLLEFFDITVLNRSFLI